MGKGREGISKGTKESGVQPFVPSSLLPAPTLGVLIEIEGGEFPMWGGSYLIHSPWVLPTLLGDYFTADGGSSAVLIEHEAAVYSGEKIHLTIQRRND